MFIAAPSDSEATAQVYKSSLDSQGFVMNLTKAWAWRPDVLDGFAALRNQLTGQSTFSRRELAVMVCAAAGELGDSYCSLAWGKTLAGESDPETAAAVIGGLAGPELTARDRALAAWARKVVRDPNATTQADVDALRQAGMTDREVFEATAFIAFRLAFSTVNDALGIHPDQELLQSVPQGVRAAITYGRAATDA